MYKSSFFDKSSDEITVIEDKAKQGDAVACYEIGCRYRYGVGVKKDSSQGISYFQNAASQGHAGACYELALLYLDGNALIGVEADLTLAEKYVRMGLDTGKDKILFDQGTYKQSKFIRQLEGLDLVITGCKEGGLLKSHRSV